MRVLADFYIHNLDPYIFHIGGFGPRYYGVAYLLGFLAAYHLIKKLSHRGMLRLNPERVPDLVLNCCIFGVLIGGRLGYVLFYDLPISLDHHTTPLLWDFSSRLPFWGVLRVNDGGMAAHGGILFTILTLAWFARKFKSQGAAFINIGDAACMVVPVGLFFGRIANFINGELYGHPSTVPWAVKFPSEIYAPTNGTLDVPTERLYDLQKAVADHLHTNPQLLSREQVEAFLSNHNDILQALMERFGTLKLDDPNQLTAIKTAIASYLNFSPQILDRHDVSILWQGAHTTLTDVLTKVFGEILPARHPSQLYEALLEGLLLFIICWSVGWFWRKQGMASGAFLTCYPIMRIIGEQFRVGDTPAHVLGMEISKGVMYSVPMFLAGAIYWGWFIKRSKIQPWVPPPPTPTPAPQSTTVS